MDEEIFKRVIEAAKAKYGKDKEMFLTYIIHQEEWVVQVNFSNVHKAPNLQLLLRLLTDSNEG